MLSNNLTKGKIFFYQKHGLNKFVQLLFWVSNYEWLQYVYL